MPQITRNSGFNTQDIVTATKLHNLVDTAVISKEVITAQGAMPYGEIANNDLLLAYDASNDALRKFEVQNILNSGLSPSFGNTTITGTEFFVSVNEGNSTLTFNTNLGPTEFAVEGADTALVDSSSIVFETNSLILKDDLEHKVLEYKYWTTETETRKEGDVTIDFTHLSTEDPASRTYITTDTKTEVDFKGPVKHTGPLTLMDSNVTIGTGEDAETVDLLSPPFKGLYDIDVSYIPDSVAFSARTTDIENSGTLCVNQSITVPEGEVWVVRYDAVVSTFTNDIPKLVWKRDNTVIIEITLPDYDFDQRDVFATQASYRLTTGTYTLTARAGFTVGSGTDNGTFGRGGIHRSISKIKV